VLELEEIDVAYGHVQALRQVSFRVEAREIVTLIGANGAGKSTSLRTISGLIRPRGGRIRFEGGDIQRRSVEAIVRLGIAHCPEGRRIFPGLSVIENLRMGAAALPKRGDLAETLDFVFELFPRLAERRQQQGWSLSGGEQQMLALGRALMGRPKLLMLDEPSLGLAPILVQQLFDAIADINRRTGLAILLVEQNAALALDLAHRAYVLETGSIALADTSERLKRDPRVREAYLGG
jgi:branched-chain amino acid transport system ATP-binding protein